MDRAGRGGVPAVFVSCSSCASTPLECAHHVAHSSHPRCHDGMQICCFNSGTGRSRRPNSCLPPPSSSSFAASTPGAWPSCSRSARHCERPGELLFHLPPRLPRPVRRTERSTRTEPDQTNSRAMRGVVQEIDASARADSARAAFRFVLVGDDTGARPRHLVQPTLHARQVRKKARHLLLTGSPPDAWDSCGRCRAPARSRWLDREVDESLATSRACRSTR